MTSKIKYYDCSSSGLGRCWYCDNKTNMVLDNEREEIFGCFACAILHYKSPKLRRKVRMLEKMKRDDFKKFLHIKNEQKAIVQEVLI